MNPLCAKYLTEMSESIRLSSFNFNLDPKKNIYIYSKNKFLLFETLSFEPLNTILLYVHLIRFL